MFLHLLNGEEKKAFIELAHLIANSNGIISEEEQQMIDTYDREMGIDIKVEDLEEMSLEAIIPVFASETSRKVSFIEAIAIAFSDGVYDDEQKHMINQMREAFGFSVAYYEQVKAWLQVFNKLYVQGLELVN
jgi:tellurite resistance protein